MSADLSDSMDTRIILRVIQGDIDIKRAISGFLIRPHPEKFSINRIAYLRAKFFSNTTQRHDITIYRMIMSISLRLI